MSGKIDAALSNKDKRVTNEEEYWMEIVRSTKRLKSRSHIQQYLVRIIPRPDCPLDVVHSLLDFACGTMNDEGLDLEEGEGEGEHPIASISNVHHHRHHQNREHRMKSCLAPVVAQLWTRLLTGSTQHEHYRPQIVSYYLEDEVHLIGYNVIDKSPLLPEWKSFLEHQLEQYTTATAAKTNITTTTTTTIHLDKCQDKIHDKNDDDQTIPSIPNPEAVVQVLNKTAIILRRYSRPMQAPKQSRPRPPIISRRRYHNGSFQVSEDPIMPIVHYLVYQNACPIMVWIAAILYPKQLQLRDVWGNVPLQYANLSAYSWRHAGWWDQAQPHIDWRNHNRNDHNKMDENLDQKSKRLLLGLSQIKRKQSSRQPNNGSLTDDDNDEDDQTEEENTDIHTNATRRQSNVENDRKKRNNNDGGHKTDIVNDKKDKKQQSEATSNSNSNNNTKKGTSFSEFQDFFQGRKNEQWKQVGTSSSSSSSTGSSMTATTATATATAASTTMNKDSDIAKPAAKQFLNIDIDKVELPTKQSLEELMTHETCVPLLTTLYPMAVMIPCIEGRLPLQSYLLSCLDYRRNYLTDITLRSQRYLALDERNVQHWHFIHSDVTILLKLHPQAIRYVDPQLQCLPIIIPALVHWSRQVNHQEYQQHQQQQQKKDDLQQGRRLQGDDSRAAHHDVGSIRHGNPATASQCHDGPLLLRRDSDDENDHDSMNERDRRAMVYSCDEVYSKRDATFETMVISVTYELLQACPQVLTLSHHKDEELWNLYEKQLHRRWKRKQEQVSLVRDEALQFKAELQSLQEINRRLKQEQKEKANMRAEDPTNERNERMRTSTAEAQASQKEHPSSSTDSINIKKKKKNNNNNTRGSTNKDTDSVAATSSSSVSSPKTKAVGRKRSVTSRSKRSTKSEQPPSSFTENDKQHLQQQKPPSPNKKRGISHSTTGDSAAATTTAAATITKRRRGGSFFQKRRIV